MSENSGCPAAYVYHTASGGLSFYFYCPEKLKRGSLPMARVTVEDCLKNVDSRFTLVHLAVRRVLQLRHGAPLVLENVKGNKEVVMALREIASYKINLDNIRLVDEAALVTAEPAPPEAETARAELRDILEEATSFGPAVEYDGPDRYFEEERPPESAPEE
jgi:DNA-directed RNA polymerase subunit omega